MGAIPTTAFRSMRPPHGRSDIRLEDSRAESLTQTVRAVATVVPDESRISHVHTRVSGWIEQLDVNTTGEEVRAGQPLAHIFSQELLSSQTEYLSARRNTAASGITSSVVASGRTRLEVLGMTPEEIDAIEQAGEPKRLVTVVAPRSGVVVNRGVTVGTSVDPSTTLLTIADLSRVWVLSEVPEAKHSSRARRRRMRSSTFRRRAGRRSPPRRLYLPDAHRTHAHAAGTAVEQRTSAVRCDRGSTARRHSRLRGQKVITVPRDAVVDTGLQQHVFVASAISFEPRSVMVGVQLADRVEIREGLKEGEQIVAAGVFLLDSESRLRATGGAGGHGHGAPSGSQESQPTPPASPHAAHRE